MFTKLYNQIVFKNDFVEIKLKLANYTSEKRQQEMLLKNINVNDLESHSLKIQYFVLKYHQYLRKMKLEKCERWLVKFENECKSYDSVYYESDIVFFKVWLLYWKLQYHDALELLDKLDNKCGNSTFYVFKSLLLLKLWKFDEAESAFNDFGLLSYAGSFHLTVSLSFIKFMRHDLSGANKLLRDWIEKENIETILNWIFLYGRKFNDFNEKKNSSLSKDSINLSLGDCFEMKKTIVKMYDNLFLQGYVLTITPL